MDKLNHWHPYMVTEYMWELFSCVLFVFFTSERYSEGIIKGEVRRGLDLPQNLTLF